ncbi:cysteine proteinase [Martensiomyces pterosporus]|nr:cysteine proteinase [Martensiomyces pterosporus]
MSPGRIATSVGTKADRVDALLAKQGKADKVQLRRRVEFRKATQSDGKMDLLRKKYKPINDISAAPGSSDKDKASAKSKGSKGADHAADSGPLDNGMVEESGFRRPAHSLFPAERLADGWHTVRPIGPGLSNLGNTCFLNSVLQCLTYTPPLAEYLLTREHSNSCRAGDNCMLCKFESHVVRALSKRESSSISPKPIVARLKLVAKHMRIGRQEDAHEFLRLLIDSFQRSLLHGVDPKIDRRIQETTLVHRIFGGYLQSQVTCSRCHHDSNTFDPLLDISLDIQSGNSISKALRSFTRPEHLGKGNRYKCEKCSKLVEATKQFTVYRLPKVLTLQLKRFSIFGGGKINRYVEFPLHLTMKGYVSSNSSEAGPFDYSLYAVLVHSGGTSRSGHYYCFVKSPAGVWYELNDSMVHQVSERTVLKQSAYLLFYERQPSRGTKQSAASVAKPSEHTKSAPAVNGDHHHHHHKHHEHGSKKVNGHHAKPSAEPMVAAASEEMEAMFGSAASRSKHSESTSREEKRKSKKSKPRKPKHVDLQTESLPPTAASVHSPKSSKKHHGVLDMKSAAAEIDQMDSQLHSRHAPEKQTTSSHEKHAVAAEKTAAALSGSTVKSAKEEASDDSATSEWVVRKKPANADKPGKVQVISWDEGAASKRSKAISVAENKPASDWSVADVRGNHRSQYGASVQSWTGTSSAADELNEAQLSKSSKKRQRRPDSWNTEYDRGRVKKAKKHKRSKFESTINPFQVLGERQGKKRST